MENEPMDDHLVGSIVSQCLLIMRNYPTITNMTACYNITERILRLFSVCNSKEYVLSLIEEYHAGIKECVEEYYSEE